MSESFVAALFYLSAGALVAGAIRGARGSVERRKLDRAGLGLVAGGLAGLLVAVLTFVNGSKSVLPF